MFDFTSGVVPTSNDDDADTESKTEINETGGTFVIIHPDSMKAAADLMPNNDLRTSDDSTIALGVDPKSSEEDTLLATDDKMVKITSESIDGDANKLTGSLIGKSSVDLYNESLDFLKLSK